MWSLRSTLVALVLVVSALANQCPLPTTPATLFSLHPDGVTMVAAESAADCCLKCSQMKGCVTWSYSGSKWTPMTPCHLSHLPPASSEPAPGTVYAGGSTKQTNTGRYVVNSIPSGKRQTIWGIGYEIQSDSIGSFNSGMPGGGTIVPDDDNTTTSAPHELTDDEQIRFATTLLPGFRWCRLALGLFLRGLSEDQQHIVGRWPSQMKELARMQNLSGIEGFAPEYWSPPPAWKSSDSYYNGTLKNFADTEFLEDFANARIADIRYLQSQGLKVPWWGLQNEPTFKSANVTPHDCATMDEPTSRRLVEKGRPEAANFGGSNSYSRCTYTQCDYYRAFKVVAPMIKKAFPGIKIHANSARGAAGASPVAQDEEAVKSVDAWTVHFVGADSQEITKQAAELLQGTQNRPVFNNEFEYQPTSSYAGSPRSTLNTAQLMLNFFTQVNSPAFYWIHALKPTTNEESKGYGLGFWRPISDTNFTHFPNIQPRHWDYAPINYHAVAGFAKIMPWDSIRYDVTEEYANPDARIMAFKTPDTSSGRGGPLHAYKTPPNSLGIVLAAGKDSTISFTYQIEVADNLHHRLNGYRFQPDAAAYNVSIGSMEIVPGQMTNFTVPPLSIEFWVEW